MDSLHRPGVRAHQEISGNPSTDQFACRIHIVIPMKKILIVEDDPIVAHIYKTRLEKEGYEVEISADGQSGFYRIHEFHPDAVLLDLMLPKMNGVDILKKIRAQSQFAQTPIIVFTNAYVPNMIHESFTAGANH